MKKVGLLFGRPYINKKWTLYYEFPYLTVAEEGDIAVGYSLYLSFHDAAEKSVAEGEDFLVGVFATHFVKELVGTFLH